MTELLLPTADMQTPFDTGTPFAHHTPPMPLKHFTETFLVIVLGASIALTGLLVATLPPLPEAALPWGALFTLSVIYPLILYGLFQRRRADNFFRNLHWYPAIILLLWLALEWLRIGGYSDTKLLSYYTLAWSLGIVVLGFVFLVSYCLKVIRRRGPRIVILAFILVPFAAVAFISERGAHWEHELASVLWETDLWRTGETGILAGIMGDRNVSKGNLSGKNLDPSVDPSEEQWRERLRAQKLRDERIAARSLQGKQVSAVSSVSSSSSAKSAMIGSVSSKPTKLPTSGFGWGGVVLFLVAMYCGVLHSRLRRGV